MMTPADIRRYRYLSVNSVAEKITPPADPAMPSRLPAVVIGSLGLVALLVAMSSYFKSTTNPWTHASSSTPTYLAGSRSGMIANSSSSNHTVKPMKPPPSSLRETFRFAAEEEDESLASRELSNRQREKPVAIMPHRSSWCVQGHVHNISFHTFDASGKMSLYDNATGETDVMLESSFKLPDRNSLRSAAKDADAVALQRELEMLHTRQNVPAAKAMVFLSAHENGVGSTINSLVLAVLDVLGKRNTLFSPPLVLWSPKELCSRQDMSCYFSSLPPVRNDTPWGQVLRSLPGAGSADRVKLAREKCKAARIDCPHLVTKTYSEKANELEILRRLPDRWLRQGRFWLVSQVLHFLTKPNDELQARLQRARTELRLDGSSFGPMLGLHVRKGDACTGRGECRRLVDFMPSVRSVASMYGIKSILLATPSLDVQEETKKYPEYMWHFLPNARDSATAQMKFKSVNTIEDGLRRRAKSPEFFNPVSEWQRYMVEIYLLASCNVFVGSFTSNAARLAYSLMAANGEKSCLKPFYSGDMNWCWAYGRFGPDISRRDNRPLGSTASC